jgi:anhydro-N-acetylmuramic acid kinase
MMKSRYRVIGVMSGTSLDGLDIASCVFENSKAGWKYDVEHAVTLRYPASLQRRLGGAHLLSGEELMALDAEYGSFIGQAVGKFREGLKGRVDFIASHGHTIFHQPSRGFTTQIGNGYSIHVASSLPVVCDFRMQDVAFGGEGAPLVPIGDRLLFGEYDVCLNLGGIANLSVEVKGKRIAYDVCFCNMALNALAGEASKKFDKNGMMAAQGIINKKLLSSLVKKYKRLRGNRPSLGREIFENDFVQLLIDKSVSLPDRMATFTESAAIEICDAIRSEKKEAQVLCTGGGAFNSFLISRMLEYGGDEITFNIPDDDVVKFKEALIFAFLGVLRVRNEVNCLKSVTGASRDSSSGTMIGF